MFFNAKVVCCSLLPECIPLPEHFPYLCLPSTLSLLFHPTLLDSPSPTGSPDDSTASACVLPPPPTHTPPSLPVSAQIFFRFWLYFKAVFSQVVLPFPRLSCERSRGGYSQLLRRCRGRGKKKIEKQAHNVQLYTNRYIGHMHMYTKINKNVSSIKLALFATAFLQKHSECPLSFICWGTEG